MNRQIRTLNGQLVVYDPDLKMAVPVDPLRSDPKLGIFEYGGTRDFDLRKKTKEELKQEVISKIKRSLYEQKERKMDCCPESGECVPAE